MSDSRQGLRRRGVPALPPRQELAVEVLAFLAADEERLGQFMALTGSTPASLRQTAASQAFADAVLAYLAANETLLVAFATERGYPPDLVGGIAQDPRVDGRLP